MINDRPLGIRAHGKTEGDLVPITPNLLLMAKTATSDTDNTLSDDEPSRLVKNQKRMEEVVGAWWNEWYSQVFSSLVPYNKWKKEKTNLEVGDVCLVKYDHKVGKADYRICRVEEVEKDAKGLVRTVTVGMRLRDSREKTLPYKSKKLKSLRLAIQRLILICSAKEVNELLEENENEATGRYKCCHRGSRQRSKTLRSTRSPSCGLRFYLGPKTPQNVIQRKNYKSG